MGEVASQKLRARTAGLAAGSSVLFGLTFNTSVPIMRTSLLLSFSPLPLPSQTCMLTQTLSPVDVNNANWGYKTAWLFLGTGIVVSILVYFYVPEPSQRNAAELDEMYEKGVPARRMRHYVTDVQRHNATTVSVGGGMEKSV